MVNKDLCSLFVFLISYLLLFYNIRVKEDDHIDNLLFENIRNIDLAYTDEIIIN